MGNRGWVIFLWAALAAAETIPGRYIVELTGSTALTRASANRRQLAVQRNAVRASQQAVRTALERRGVEVLDSVDTVANALLVSADDAAAAGLASLPGVQRIYPVRRHKLFLNAALPLHKVPEAWALIGAENAGAGAKIAIIDTGIDTTHPGMQDASMTAPDGYPRTNADSDADFTNGKVIVARSYAKLFEKPEDDLSARDRIGHGTGVAMAAAGALNTGPLGPITGVAPKAWLGSYKIFGSTGINQSTNTALILKALDDAVADGMDVINLSLGSTLAPRFSQDIEAQAVEAASQAGVIVVVSSGNDGNDPNTVASPGTAPSALTVGAWRNSRFFSSAVLAGDAVYSAIPGSGPRPRQAVRGPLADVSALDQNGQACSALPAGGLTGKVALVFRGVCFFEDKLNNVQQAGAIAAVVYTDQARPDPSTMGVGQATLPAEMISYSDGLALRSQLSRQPDLSVTVDFALRAFPAQKKIASFSGSGPSVELGIKPDLVAAGTDIYTAGQQTVPDGDLYAAGGYLVVDGTSFSAPIAAGAAALVKLARPGLSSAQYRSLLVNGAAVPENGGVQETGGGVMDVEAALRSRIVAEPVSLSFGSGGGTLDTPRTVSLSNVGSAAAALQLSVVPRIAGPAPELSASQLHLDPGQKSDLSLRFQASGLGAGAYEGYIRIVDPDSGVETRVPYWLAVGPDVPAHVTILEASDSGAPGSRLRQAIVFRVTDAAGVIVNDVQPVVTVADGNGLVLNVASDDREVPGAWVVSVKLGDAAGSNQFKIEAGSVEKTVLIVGR